MPKWNHYILFTDKLQLYGGAVFLDESLHQFDLMHGVCVNHQEYLAGHAGDQSFEKFTKHRGVHAALHCHETGLER
jgi:hypothetical protein